MTPAAALAHCHPQLGQVQTSNPASPTQMARYSLLTIVTPSEQIHQLLLNILADCTLEKIYDTGDYVMAREIPNSIPFAQLVTAEVLIDKTNASATELRMEFVIKNEELPLQSNNHCHQMHGLIKQKLLEGGWQIIASGDG
jgi:hypothetical protein